MKLRLPPFLLLAVFVAACSGAADDSGAMAEGEEAATETSAEDAAVAALEEIRAGYEESYNLLNASVVADFYTDSAVSLLADGTISAGREDIRASLEAAMGGSPTLGLTTLDNIVLGDWAVARGAYTVDMAPEGADAVAFSGNYITVFRNVDGQWKIGAVLTNYDSPRPEEWVWGTAPEGGPPPDQVDGPVTDLVQEYMTHYNLGHASMVADLHSDDAVTTFASVPLVEGRAAIQAALEEQLAAGQPNLTVHDIFTEDLGDGWYVDIGWYEVTSPTPDGDATTVGTYLTIVETDAEGARKIRWSATNGRTTM